MSVNSVMRTAWNYGSPPAGKVVEVWHFTTVMLAMWDGSEWRTVEGDVLHGVTHWRWRQ